MHQPIIRVFLYYYIYIKNLQYFPDHVYAYLLCSAEVFCLEVMVLLLKIWNTMSGVTNPQKKDLSVSCTAGLCW